MKLVAIHGYHIRTNTTQRFAMVSSRCSVVSPVNRLDLAAILSDGVYLTISADPTRGVGSSSRRNASRNASFNIGHLAFGKKGVQRMSRRLATSRNGRGGQQFQREQPGRYLRQRFKRRRDSIKISGRRASTGTEISCAFVAAGGTAAGARRTTAKRRQFATGPVEAIVSESSTALAAGR